MDTVETVAKKRTKKDWLDKQAKDLINDKLLKGFITTLLAIAALTASDEYQSLKDDNPLNYWNMIFIVFLCIIIYAGYQVAYRNMNKLSISNNVNTYQDGIQTTIFEIANHMTGTMLPEASTIEDKLKIIRSIPDIFGLVPVETLQKTTASGFQVIAELFTSSEIRAKDNAVKLLNSIEDSINNTTKSFKSLMTGKAVVDENPVADPLLPAELQTVPATPATE